MKHIYDATRHRNQTQLKINNDSSMTPIAIQKPKLLSSFQLPQKHGKAYPPKSKIAQPVSHTRNQTALIGGSVIENNN